MMNARDKKPRLRWYFIIISAYIFQILWLWINLINGLFQLLFLVNECIYKSHLLTLLYNCTLRC